MNKSEHPTMSPVLHRSLFIFINDQNGEVSLFLVKVRAVPALPASVAALTPAHGCLNSKQRALLRPTRAAHTDCSAVQVQDERMATASEIGASPPEVLILACFLPWQKEEKVFGCMLHLR